MKQRTVEKQRAGVYFILFAYWLVLLIWQNIRGTSNRDTMDILIKAFLVLALMAAFLIRKRTINSIALVIFLVFTLIYTATKIPTKSFSFGSAMYYFFPLIMFLLIFGIGTDFTITRKELVRLCYILIVTVLYIVVYALIFQSDKYVQALTVQNAYGNELSSFLVSSHECGFYLAFGLMAAILIFELDGKLNAFKTTFLVICIVLFFVTLVLTFSRTAILAFFAMFLWYTFSSGRRKLKKVFLCIAIAALLIVALIPQIREYFLLVVFKNNNDAGRNELAEAGFGIIKNSSAYNLLFGYDQAAVKNYMMATCGHASVHNAYLQTFVCNGFVGFVFLIGCLVYEVRHIHNTLKKVPEWKKLTTLFYSFVIAFVIIMAFQTSCLFSSTIDSYFLTFFCFVVPIYVGNAIRQGVFDPPEKEEMQR